MITEDLKLGSKEELLALKINEIKKLIQTQKPALLALLFKRMRGIKYARKRSF